MFLITTADERSWKEDEKVMFLGEWCKIYSRRHKWKKYEYNTIPYHWSDRKRFFQEHTILTTIYEKYLIELSSKLNKIHNTNYSTRYWRIVIGPWLRHFIDVIFDRYSSIKSAINCECITNTWIISRDEEYLVPKDFEQFYSNIINDSWNHHIYGEIIKLTNGFNYSIKKDNVPSKRMSLNVSDFNIIKSIKTLLLNNYSNLIPDRLNKIVFVSSYFSHKRDLMKLQISLNQIPYLFSPIIEIPNIPANFRIRNQLMIDSYSTEFEHILNKIIPHQLPKSYLETFTAIQLNVDKRFPKKAKEIFTANAYSHDDGFKIWAGGLTKIGTKLLIGQHGGNLGTALWEQREDHQIAISDKYYSWGWDRQNCSNIKPMPATKLVHLKNNMRSQNFGPILITLASFPRYFYCSFSMPVASQALDCYSQQVDLLNMLDQNILKITKIRLNTPDHGWELKERFSADGFGNIVEGTDIKLLDRLKKCRLCIATQNATVFLETFTANFPTIIIWNPEYYEIRDSAKGYFYELEKVGILHYTPKSASILLNKIYNNPMKWWKQDMIQRAKNRFCERYAYVGENWMAEWRGELSPFVEG
jgi:putative transferase (TIGR04331 family)